MKGSVRRFIELPLPDQAATFEALAAVTAARIRLSLYSQPKLNRLLEPLVIGSRFNETSKVIGYRGSVERVVAAVRRASRRVPGATCLVQAIAGCRMLESRSIRSKIRIGVDKDHEKFSAHAWLTVDDKIVLGGADASARFVELRSSSIV